ncbi:dihydrodipicolinate synthase family protein [Actinoalloteichus hymeniacidonis]|uniref:Dihydrodipicolinate synthase/N-acetylneuraminate lyase n=1 Tax=Actinoalloteichus hymeniacidonis TaxID=340345 RepID=A0AAC9HQV7_9PSEU|nr:dihydrodipicolinate synthase family protein [Actinoalloteichus hymeniacidonis]AOS63760.1 dihydrodipicolinate synthase/N-acetylneuraminate lyase [Actinoalloteichus hymeniacidonis]MBB5908186.1 4-hydroxy-tetrahydrodipicolinate synthase [Actinoalloteichus hymeniacidonis]
MTGTQFDLGGVIVATTLAFKEDPAAPAGLAVDYDRFAAHCDWLMNNGCRGVGPNGSLGEYSSLTDEERRKVIQVARETVGDRGLVVAGVHGVGWHQAKHWAELAAEDGADGVLLLPPTIFRANEREIIEHYEKVNEVGLPIMAYNNPFDTKVDLTPDLLAKIDGLENLVAIKEFSGDVRRVMEILDKTNLQVIAGADDLLFESLVAGATGWFAGYPNAFPREAVELYELVMAGRIDEARELYRNMVPVFAWDSKTEFVQAIKLSIDVIGESYGGVTRPPRGPLSETATAAIRRDTERALAYTKNR